MQLKTTTAILLLLFMCSSLSAQVQGVKLFLEHDPLNDLVACKMMVAEGSASALFDRVQLNSQYTVVVPTGSELTVVESFNPKQGNQNYEGTEATPWIVGSKVIAPEAMPENDYYSITPQLTPTGFYDDLAEGDGIHLFTLRISNNQSCSNTNVRVYNSELDPDSQAPGMYGGDFSCGFTLGNLIQLYDGNIILEAPAEPAIDQSSMASGNCTKIQPVVDCLSFPISYEWSTGATTPSIEVCPDQNELYSVTVTDGTGIAVTSTINFDVTNPLQALSFVTSTLDQESFFGIYPNPVQDAVNIESIYNIDVVDVLQLDGKVISTVIGSKAQTQSVSLSELQSGTYFLNIMAEGHKQIKKIVKL